MSELPPRSRIVHHPGGVWNDYWVVMGPPPGGYPDPDDMTMEEISNRYVNKGALLAAIERGDAWK